MAKYHLAEEAVLQQKIEYAQNLLNGIFASAGSSDPAYLKAKDLEVYIKTLKPISN